MKQGNQYVKLIGVLAIFYAIGVVYDKYNKKVDENDRINNYDMVQQYLLNESNLVNSKKPILWIHSEYEVNSRDWESFYSRNNTNLNQPYLYLTMKSIIDKCGDSFNICLIDDNSFVKLLPGWSVSLSHVGNPVKKHLRYIALCKLLDYYGGFYVPNSLLVTNDLIEMYNQGISSAGCFTVENVCDTSVSSVKSFFPDHRFLASTKDNATMKELILYLENMHSTDLTNEQDFLGEVDRWLYMKSLPNQANSLSIIDGRFIGVKDAHGKPVSIEQLLGEDYINFNKPLYGIYIPSDKILSRNRYAWFANLSAESALKANTILSKHMLTNN